MSSNGDEHSIKKCSYYLVKRKRYCLTSPLEDSKYCEIHADRVSEIDIESIAQHENGCDNEASNKSRCRFWLAKKRRYCKVLPKEGLIYCSEHANNMQVGSDRVRIPCTYDPRHSCYEDQLESHLKKCNSRPTLRPEYFEEGINSGDKSNSETLKVVVHDIDMQELNDVISKVRTCHTKYSSGIRKGTKNHAIFQATFQDPSNGVSALKHLKQQASLVGHLNEMKFLSGRTTYVEFGAGRGGLSHWVQLANVGDDCRYLLVDKSSVRYKKDSFHKGADQGPSFERLKINIQDFVLDEVPSCQDSGNEIVGIGKHLCGNATDFMLRCMSNSRKLKLKGIILATCCHHRCEWKSYVGQDWFLKHDLNQRFFQILTKISAWATCGRRQADDKHTVDNENYNHPRYGSLRHEEREAIGFMAKNLIDLGRIEYLKENDFESELVEYICKSVTLESYAIMAKKVDAIAGK